MSISWLVRFLGIDRRRLVSEGEEGFRLRLKLQKAAYLLKRMGVEPFTKYEFNTYLRGPYSPDLAKDYYNTSREEECVPSIDSERLELLKWFIDHDERWLETASSILSILEKYPNIANEQLLSLLRMSKPWITDKDFDAVYNELKGRGLIGRKTILVS